MLLMRPAGFAPWVMENPPEDALRPTDFKVVEVWSDGDVKLSFTIDPNNVPPQLDIDKLYWRPARS